MVTGAASGLGLAIAKKLNDEGGQVALLDLNETALQEAAVNVGPSALAFPIDLTNELQVSKVVSRLRTALAGLIFS